MTNLSQELLGASESAQARGRWIDALSYGGSSIDGGINEDGSKGPCPDGFYDEEEEFPHEDPPEVDRSHAPIPDDLKDRELDRARLLFVGGRWLRPAYWDPYTPEENESWLIDMAGLMKRAAHKARDMELVLGQALNAMVEARKVIDSIETFDGDDERNRAKVQEQLNIQIAVVQAVLTPTKAQTPE